MGAFFDFFRGIGGTIISFFDAIIDFLADTAYLVTLTGEFVLRIPSYLAWLPDGVLALIVSCFTIVVLYKVLGREG